MNQDSWRVDVTDSDVAAAKSDWERAGAGGDAARVALLHESYERLVRTQGRQLGEAFRRQLAHRGGSSASDGASLA